MPEKNAAESSKLLEILEGLFKEIDQASIQAEVAALKEANPGQSREQLAELLTKKAATRVASVGAAAGIPGGALGILAMAPDIFNLVLQQSRLVLAIAFLYEHPPDVKERFKEVVATLATSTGASAGNRAARTLIAKGLEHAVEAKLARKIFGRALVKKIPSVAPILGTVAGGAINYFSMRTVGKAATAFYAARAAEDAAAITPAEPQPKRRRAAPKKSVTTRKKTTRKAPAKARAPRKKPTE